MIGLSFTTSCPAELSLYFSMIPRTFLRNAFTFFLAGVVNTAPFWYLRTCCPRKSKPSSMCVMTVFSQRVGETSLFHEGFDDRLDLLFQQLFLSSCHKKVIPISR